MKHLILSSIAVCLFLSGNLFAQTDPPPPSDIPLPSGTNVWKNIFNDDFNGTEYDQATWSHKSDWGGISSFNGGREKYYESQIQLSDGICHLVAEPHPTITAFEGSYMSGEILTCRETPSGDPPYKFTFQYGYIEASIRIVDIPGFFGAFWMLPAKTNYVYEWEVDILEVLGHDTQTMHQTYHYRPGLPYNLARNTSWGTLDNPGRNGTGPDTTFRRAFHRFGCDWQPDHLTFYINGIECGTFDNPGISNENIPNSPGYIIIQQMVENTWIQNSCCQLPNLTLSESFDIDYVRVWQAEYDSSVGIEPAPAFTPDYEGFKIWPNPSGELLYVNRSIPSITIHDVDGKILAVLPVKERQVNWKQALPDLRSGMYPVSTDDGRVIKRMMLIK